MENQPFVDDCYPAMLLPKPFTQELCENILIAFRARLDALSTFDYHEYGAEHSIPCNDIYFFSMESQHLMITTMSGTYQDASLKLKDVERDFNSNGFFRCHKSHIINLRYYDRQDYSSVYLNCHGKTYQIRLSKGKRQELKETVANWKSRSRLWTDANFGQLMATNQNRIALSMRFWFHFAIYSMLLTCHYQAKKPPWSKNQGGLRTSIKYWINSIVTVYCFAKAIVRMSTQWLHYWVALD